MAAASSDPPPWQVREQVPRPRVRFWLCRRVLARPGHPRIFFHAYQFQAEVAESVEDAVKVGLIMDLADEGALLAAWLQSKPLECGR